MTSDRTSDRINFALLTAAFSLVATMNVGCKKNVDPAAFDAGATTASATVAATETAPTAEPSTSAAPLASLDPPKVVVAPKVAAKPTASAPKTIEACDKAKLICPNAGRASQSQCLAFTAECTKQGGHL